MAIGAAVSGRGWPAAIMAAATRGIKDAGMERNSAGNTRAGDVYWLKMKTMFNPRRSLTGIGVLTVLALLLAAPLTAFAHAKLKRSAPADKASFPEAPKQIELWFDELLDQKFNSIEVYLTIEVNSKEHKNLAEGEPKVDEKDRTHLTIPLKPLPPGDYTVDWRVLSRDGHSAPGRFSFKVAAPK